MDWNIAIPISEDSVVMIFSTLFVNMVRFGPVTPDFTRIVSVYFLVAQQRSYLWYVRFGMFGMFTALAGRRHCCAARATC